MSECQPKSKSIGIEMMINAAVIGLGRMGLMYDFDEKRDKPSSHVLAYAMNTDYCLRSAADLNPDQEKYLRQISPETAYYQDYTELLCSHPDLDVVSICTPPEGRLSLITDILSLTKVKVIFCEKPIASSLEEALQIVDILKNSKVVFIPNLSRRWNSGIRRVRQTIKELEYGPLEKIHLRYTRGIYNTGSHLFDLIRYFVGPMASVQVLNQVKTSSERDGEPTYSFVFNTLSEVSGFAEAFNDANYYMFEIDLYLENGKIEIRDSGNEIKYYTTGKHALFEGFSSLHLQKVESSLLKESNLAQAIKHISDVIHRNEPVACDIEDGIYPLQVAQALVLSFQKSGSWEKVVNTIE
jgi:predicted dehydrogenase